MLIFCKDIKQLDKFEIQSVITALQAEIESRAPNLTPIQLAMAKGLLNDGMRIGLIKELREWFPGMGLREAKLAMEAIEAEHGPKR